MEPACGLKSSGAEAKRTENREEEMNADRLLPALWLNQS